MRGTGTFSACCGRNTPTSGTGVWRLNTLETECRGSTPLFPLHVLYANDKRRKGTKKRKLASSTRTAFRARSTDARRPHRASAARALPVTASATRSLSPPARNRAASRAVSPFTPKRRRRPATPLWSRNKPRRRFRALRRRPARPEYSLPDAQARSAASSTPLRAVASEAASCHRRKADVASTRDRWARARRPDARLARRAAAEARATALHVARPRDSARKRRRPASAARRRRPERRAAAPARHRASAWRGEKFSTWARARASAIPSRAKHFQCATTLAARAFRRRRRARWSAASCVVR